MMNLFSLIAEQIRDRQELFDNEGKIMQTLLNNGHRLQDADAALTLMQELVRTEADRFFGPERSKQHPLATRTMSREERSRFSVEAFGFVTKLTHLGIISEEQREDLLERAMAVYPNRIEFDHIKSLIAFNLFTNPQERDQSAAFRRIKDTSWN